VRSRRAADGHRGRRPPAARGRQLAGGVSPRRADRDRRVPDDRRRLGPTAVRAVRGRVGTDARRVLEIGARNGRHGRTDARAGGEPRAGRGARCRRRRRPDGAGDRRRAAGGRGARTDRRRRGGGRVGPKVALRRVADPAGRDRPVSDQDAVPDRLAKEVGGQRGGDRVRGRVHVQSVPGLGHRAAGGRGRAARGRPSEDDRPERSPGPHMHVPHAAQGGQAAGRLVRRNGRHRRGHAGQAHELHAHLQRAQRRRQVRLGRGQLRVGGLRDQCRGRQRFRSRLQLHVHRPVGRFGVQQGGHGVQRSLSRRNYFAIVMHCTCTRVKRTLHPATMTYSVV